MADRTPKICCTLFLGLILYTAPVLGQSDLIVNEGETIYYELGQTLVLTCMVNNPQNRPVEWWFVDHELQISNKEEILLPNSHYSIERPQGGDHPQWNLRISTALPGDMGTYRCKVQGTNSNITSTLILKTETPRGVNFTECCVNEGVSAECLPICFPSQVNLDTFEPYVCSSDLLKLLKCGADGRNHIPCCRRRLIPSQCLGFCANRPPSNIGLGHAVCLEKGPLIIECFEEGQQLLPSSPKDVSASVLTSTSLYIKWMAPEEGNVTGYRVYYKDISVENYNSSDVVTETQYQLTNLKPTTVYVVYVEAFNNHGSSLPSNMFRITTRVSIETVPGSSVSEEFSDCCTRQGVSSQCNRLLCTTQSFQNSGQDVSVCIPEMHKVFVCIAGERNHSLCCQARAVPDFCSNLCEAQLTKPTLSTVECYTSYMSDIVNCFNEGRGILPGPPVRIVIHEVTESTAVLRWDPPASNADKVDNFVVLYKERSQETFSMMTTKELSLKLTGLKQGTAYVVKAVSVNDKGSSLPTPEIFFLTYYPQGNVVPSMPTPVAPGPPPTVADCCVTENVKAECQPLCNITASFNDVNFLAVTCEQDLGRIFMCISGGTDHTPCCQRNGVAEGCLVFCAFDRETVSTFQFDFAHFACVAQSYQITQCISESATTHPTWPEQIYIHNYTAHTISLSWQRPRRLPSSGTNITYIVRYRLDSVTDENMKWTEIEIPGSQQSYIIQGLDASTRYAVQVLAAAGEARSLPADTLQLNLLPDKIEPPPLLPNLNFTAPADVTECCIEEGVTTECLPACEGKSSIVSGDCARQLDKLLRCAADNRDHRQCCTRSNVPDQCLNFCMGNGEIDHLVSMICLSFSQQIVQCFHEGFQNLPSSPQFFTVTDIRSTFMTLTWSAPMKNSAGIKYDLFYQHNQQPPQKADDITSPYNLTSLKPFTLYSIFLVAENQYGISPPTPKVDVWTLIEDLPDLHVRQIPGGYIEEQTSVTLNCITDAGPDVYLYWILNNGTEVTDALIDIKAVTRAHTGRYTCIADNHLGKRVSKDLYLHVRFAPEPRVLESPVYVERDQGLTAHLSCEFSGFPVTVRWMKNGIELTPNLPDANRYQKTLITFEEKGLMVAKLEIQGVVSNDYGSYSCIGENRQGHSGKDLQLLDPNPEVPPTPGSIAPKVPNVTACCISKGVQAQCQPACTFDVDLSKIKQLESPLRCIGDLDELVECAADGKNHTKCCVDSDVPEVCYPFCSGNSPDLVGHKHIVCLGQIEKIIDCMEEGAILIPGRPRHVRAKLNDEGYIKVWWDKPLSNPDIVQQYYIKYKPILGSTKMESVPIGITSFVLAGIHSNTEYEIHVEAHNHHGSSSQSNHVFIKTKQFTPSAPKNLRGHLVRSTHVRLEWEIPDKHPGAVTHYRIFFRSVGTKQWMDESSQFVETTYRLDNLKPETSYEIYVKAISSTHASNKSNTIKLTTGVELPPENQRQGDKRNRVAVGAGVGIAVLILALLIAAGVVAFFYFRKSRKQGSAYKESVSFENPGFATASEGQVSGLPSYESKQPGGGEGPVIDGRYIEPSIMRESVDGHSDQGYSTLSHTPATTPTTATLQVSKPTTTEHQPVDLDEVAAKL